MYRNRIIRMELNITMAGCAIAMTTAVAGLFGMNVPIPLGLDRDAGAFALVSGASLLLGAGAFGVAYGVVHQGWWGRGRRIDDIHALHCLLEDMSAIEFTLASLSQPRAARRLAAERGAALPSPRNVRVMRSEFKQLLASGERARRERPRGRPRLPGPDRTSRGPRGGRAPGASSRAAPDGTTSAGRRHSTRLRRLRP